ncbi:hypothetical protein [Leptospira sp. GIMC2001]|uniref:hypothetical protein n=1 Tax=Leptospira sp. GIMC2001 TaxID=1513297 RepID=UPI002348F3EE|nr:hypothetical protein [Leptospira sp. GIMC2001]WCL51160.1 hypothetical protein O4O04_10205 [Leptospira sp. GIMC2001]
MKIVFSKDHLLKVFVSTYQITRVIDIEVDQFLNPTENTLLCDWIDGMDLIRKTNTQLDHYRNTFNSSIPETDFTKLWTSNTSTLGDLAEIISKHSEPMEISPWKFGGRQSKHGSILRFLLKKLNSFDSKKRITGTTSINTLAKKKDWFFVDKINTAFPGILPPPIFISHSKLVPIHIRRIQKFFLITLVALAIGLISSIFYNWIELFFAFVISLLALVISMLIYKRVIKIPKTDHYIFPGIGSMRTLVCIICSKT